MQLSAVSVNIRGGLRRLDSTAVVLRQLVMVEDLRRNAAGWRRARVTATVQKCMCCTSDEGEVSASELACANRADTWIVDAVDLKTSIMSDACLGQWLS